MTDITETQATADHTDSSQMTLKIEIVAEDGFMPFQATAFSAAADVKSAVTKQIQPGETALIPLGFKAAVPPMHVMLLFIRSGTAKKGLALANGVGVIDADYRGEVCALVHNTTDTAIDIERGQRIAQFIILPLPAVSLASVKSLPDTARGEGGFGSTGTH